MTSLAAVLPRAPRVVTRAMIRATPARVWESLMFFEQIERRPPLLLRLLLPAPLKTIGRKSEVGDEAACLYEGGRLIKRVTRVERGRLYEFSVARQELRFGGGIALEGGSYSLRALAGGRCELAAETRYRGARGPRLFWEPIEKFVCHAFHRYILSAIGAAAEGAGRG